MSDASNRETLLWRLAETIAWCAPKATSADPLSSMRSPALMPRGFRFVDKGPSGHWLEPAANNPNPLALPEMVNSRVALRPSAVAVPL